MWSWITRDPKLHTFLKELQENPTLKKNKLIIFTESKETAVYLADHIDSASEERFFLTTVLQAKQ